MVTVLLGVVDQIEDGCALVVDVEPILCLLAALYLLKLALFVDSLHVIPFVQVSLMLIQHEPDHVVRFGLHFCHRDELTFLLVRHTHRIESFQIFLQ